MREHISSSFKEELAMAGWVFPVSEAIQPHHGSNSCASMVDYALVDAFTNVASNRNLGCRVSTTEFQWWEVDANCCRPNLAPQWQHSWSSESPLAIMKTACRRRQMQMVQLNVSVSTISMIRKSTVFLMINALTALDEGIHNPSKQCKQFSCHFTLSDYSYMRY